LGPCPEYFAVENGQQKVWVNNILIRGYENNAVIAEKMLMVIQGKTTAAIDHTSNNIQINLLSNLFKV